MDGCQGLNDQTTSSTTNPAANGDSTTVNITNKVSDSYYVTATQSVGNNSNFNFYGGSDVSSTSECSQHLIDKVSER